MGIFQRLIEAYLRVPSYSWAELRCQAFTSHPMASGVTEQKPHHLHISTFQTELNMRRIKMDVFHVKRDFPFESFVLVVNVAYMKEGDAQL